MDFCIQGQVSLLLCKSQWLRSSCGKGSPALGEDLAQGLALSQRIFFLGKAET